MEAADIVSYLVLQTSFITAKQFKARKSLEAYNPFLNGWVKDVFSRKVAGKHVVTGWPGKQCESVGNSYSGSYTVQSCCIVYKYCCIKCNCLHFFIHDL